MEIPVFNLEIYKKYINQSKKPNNVQTSLPNNDIFILKNGHDGIYTRLGKKSENNLKDVIINEKRENYNYNYLIWNPQKPFYNDKSRNIINTRII